MKKYHEAAHEATKVTKKSDKIQKKTMVTNIKKKDSADPGYRGNAQMHRGSMLWAAIFLAIILLAQACAAVVTDFKKGDTLLEVKVIPTTSRVLPGDELHFNLSIKNSGTQKFVDIHATYTIVESSTGNTVIKETDFFTVTDSVIKSQSLVVPEGLSFGLYSLKAELIYGNTTVLSSATFYLAEPPPKEEIPVVITVFWSVVGSWLTYVILLIGIPLFFLGRRYYRAWLAKKKEKQRYVFPLDMTKLPKNSSNAVYIGKVAETNKKAYFEMDKLMLHMLSAGATGSGKTVASQVVAEEVLMRDVAVIVFDPTFQWSGFAYPCKDQKMLDMYPRFGMSPTAARRFKTNIIVVEDPNMVFEVKKYMKQGEMTVVSMHKLSIKNINEFVKKTIDAVFEARFETSDKLKLLMVYDEVHRLLPKYGGKDAYTSLERGAREFRKWGIGIVMISQVLMDFRAAITTNIGTEIQLRTKYRGDINRIKQKYGNQFAQTLARLQIGTALVQNAEYNEGRPYFIEFRPLLHDTSQISEELFNKMRELGTKLDALKAKIDLLKKKGKDTYKLDMEFKLADDKVKEGNMHMAELYLESVEKDIKLMGQE